MMTTDEMAKAVIMHLTGRPEDPTPTLLKMLDDFRDKPLRVAASDDLFRHAIKIRDEALRKIAYWTPTVCYEHDDRRYVDIEEVFTLKRIAADSHIGATTEGGATLSHAVFNCPICGTPKCRLPEREIRR